MSTLSSDEGLRVGITSFAAWMLGGGSIIGSMAWLIHGPMLARAGALAAIVAWLIAGIMSLPLALILMELSSMFPQAGGPYVYKFYALKRLIPGSGEMLGFLTGWLFWIAIIVGLACMANGLANLLAAALFIKGQTPIWFAPLVIITLSVVTTVLNLQTVRTAASINIVFTLMKVAMAVFFCLLVLLHPGASLANLVNCPVDPLPGQFWGKVASIFMLAMAGFSFMEMTGCMSAETRDASKSVPRAVFLTLLTVTAIYLVICISIASVAPLTLSADKTTLVMVGSTVQANCPALAGAIAGPIGGNLFTAAVVASIVGCGFTALLGISRVSYSMAKTKLFPRQFAQLCPSTGVPKHALWFQFWCMTIIALAASLLSHTSLFPDAYTFLAEVFGFMYAFVAMLYGICVVSLRYSDPAMERPSRIGRQGNLLVWLVASLTVAVWGYAAFFCVNWVHQAAGLAVLLAGLPIYFYYKHANSETEKVV